MEDVFFPRQSFTSDGFAARLADERFLDALKRVRTELQLDPVRLVTDGVGARLADAIRTKISTLSWLKQNSPQLSELVLYDKPLEIFRLLNRSALNKRHPVCFACETRGEREQDKRRKRRSR